MTLPLQQLRYHLLADGSSDRVLTDVIDWLLLSYGYVGSATFSYAREYGKGKSLGERARLAVEQSEAIDVLFVHRDAEGEAPLRREREIREAIRRLAALPGVIAVIPVRMTEAWLLIDEAAIRTAAGNPKGSAPLNMPDANRLERLPDPKMELHKRLHAAASQRARLRKRLNLNSAVHDVAANIQSFEPLRKVASFQRLEAEMREWLDRRPV